MNRKHLSLSYAIVTTLSIVALSLFWNIAAAAASNCSGPYVKTAQHCGSGGRAFADNLTETKRIYSVSIRHGSFVDAIQTKWKTKNGKTIKGNRHGGAGGKESSFTLSPGEHINRIVGRSGKFIDQLTFYTNLGNKHGPYGGNGGRPFSLYSLCVGGFYGKSGKYLDSFGAWDGL